MGTTPKTTETTTPSTTALQTKLQPWTSTTIVIILLVSTTASSMPTATTMVSTRATNSVVTTSNKVTTSPVSPSPLPTLTTHPPIPPIPTGRTTVDCCVLFYLVIVDSLVFPNFHFHSSCNKYCHHLAWGGCGKYPTYVVRHLK